MKCKSCGHAFSAGPIGQGFSSSPGLFLIVSVIGFVIVLVGYGMSPQESPMLRVLLMVMGGGLTVGGFVLTQVAQDDATAYGPRRCPNCNAEVPVRSWSL